MVPASPLLGKVLLDDKLRCDQALKPAEQSIALAVPSLGNKHGWRSSHVRRHAACTPCCSLFLCRRRCISIAQQFYGQ